MDNKNFLEENASPSKSRFGRIHKPKVSADYITLNDASLKVKPPKTPKRPYIRHIQKTQINTETLQKPETVRKTYTKLVPKQDANIQSRVIAVNEELNEFLSAPKQIKPLPRPRESLSSHIPTTSTSVKSSVTAGPNILKRNLVNVNQFADTSKKIKVVPSTQRVSLPLVKKINRANNLTVIKNPAIRKPILQKCIVIKNKQGQIVDIIKTTNVTPHKNIIIKPQNTVSNYKYVRRLPQTLHDDPDDSDDDDVDDDEDEEDDEVIELDSDEEESNQAAAVPQQRSSLPGNFRILNQAPGSPSRRSTQKINVLEEIIIKKPSTVVKKSVADTSADDNVESSNVADTWEQNLLESDGGEQKVIVESINDDFMNAIVDGNAGEVIQQVEVESLMESINESSVLSTEADTFVTVPLDSGVVQLDDTIGDNKFTIIGNLEMEGSFDHENISSNLEDIENEIPEPIGLEGIDNATHITQGDVMNESLVQVINDGQIMDDQNIDNLQISTLEGDMTTTDNDILRQAIEDGQFIIAGDGTETLPEGTTIILDDSLLQGALQDVDGNFIQYLIAGDGAGGMVTVQADQLYTQPNVDVASMQNVDVASEKMIADPISSDIVVENIDDSEILELPEGGNEIIVEETVETVVDEPIVEDPMEYQLTKTPSFDNLEDDENDYALDEFSDIVSKETTVSETQPETPETSSDIVTTESLQDIKSPSEAEIENVATEKPLVQNDDDIYSEDNEESFSFKYSPMKTYKNNKKKQQMEIDQVLATEDKGKNPIKSTESTKQEDKTTKHSPKVQKEHIARHTHKHESSHNERHRHRDRDREKSRHRDHKQQSSTEKMSSGHRKSDEAVKSSHKHKLSTSSRSKESLSKPTADASSKSSAEKDSVIIVKQRTTQADLDADLALIQQSYKSDANKTKSSVRSSKVEKDSSKKHHGSRTHSTEHRDKTSSKKDTSDKHAKKSVSSEYKSPRTLRSESKVSLEPERADESVNKAPEDKVTIKKNDSKHPDKKSSTEMSTEKKQDVKREHRHSTDRSKKESDSKPGGKSVPESNKKADSVAKTTLPKDNSSIRPEDMGRDMIFDIIGSPLREFKCTSSFKPADKIIQPREDSVKNEEKSNLRSTDAVLGGSEDDIIVGVAEKAINVIDSDAFVDVSKNVLETSGQKNISDVSENIVITSSKKKTGKNITSSDAIIDVSEKITKTSSQKNDDKNIIGSDVSENVTETSSQKKDSKSTVDVTEKLTKTSSQKNISDISEKNTKPTVQKSISDVSEKNTKTTAQKSISDVSEKPVKTTSKKNISDASENIINTSSKKKTGKNITSSAAIADVSEKITQKNDEKNTIDFEDIIINTSIKKKAGKNIKSSDVIADVAENAAKTSSQKNVSDSSENIKKTDTNIKSSDVIVDVLENVTKTTSQKNDGTKGSAEENVTEDSSLKNSKEVIPKIIQKTGKNIKASDAVVDVSEKIMKKTLQKNDDKNIKSSDVSEEKITKNDNKNRIVSETIDSSLKKKHIDKNVSKTSDALLDVTENITKNSSKKNDDGNIKGSDISEKPTKSISDVSENINSSAKKKARKNNKASEAVVDVSEKITQKNDENNSNDYAEIIINTSSKKKMGKNMKTDVADVSEKITRSSAQKNDGKIEASDRFLNTSSKKISKTIEVSDVVVDVSERITKTSSQNITDVRESIAKDSSQKNDNKNVTDVPESLAKTSSKKKNIKTSDVVADVSKNTTKTSSPKNISNVSESIVNTSSRKIRKSIKSSDAVVDVAENVGPTSAQEIDDKISDVSESIVNSSSKKKISKSIKSSDTVVDVAENPAKTSSQKNDEKNISDDSENITRSKKKTTTDINIKSSDVIVDVSENFTKTSSQNNDISGDVSEKITKTRSQKNISDVSENVIKTSAKKIGKNIKASVAVVDVSEKITKTNSQKNDAQKNVIDASESVFKSSDADVTENASNAVDDVAENITNTSTQDLNSQKTDEELLKKNEMHKKIGIIKLTDISKLMRDCKSPTKFGKKSKKSKVDGTNERITRSKTIATDSDSDERILFSSPNLAETAVPAVAPGLVDLDIASEIDDIFSSPLPIPARSYRGKKSLKTKLLQEDEDIVNIAKRTRSSMQKSEVENETSDNTPDIKKIKLGDITTSPSRNTRRSKLVLDAEDDEVLKVETDDSISFASSQSTPDVVSFTPRRRGRPRTKNRSRSQSMEPKETSEKKKNDRMLRIPTKFIDYCSKKKKKTPLSSSDQLGDILDDVEFIKRTVLNVPSDESVEVKQEPDEVKIKIEKPSDDYVYDSGLMVCDADVKMEIKQEPEDVDSYPVEEIQTSADMLKHGDLAFGKLGTYPYWPCMIVKDPATNVFKKTSVKNSWIYHVRFFGDKGRRSWIRQPNVLPFSNDDMSEHYSKIKSKRFSDINGHRIPVNLVDAWQQGVEEATSLMPKSIQERYDFFFDMFASNREKKLRKHFPEYGTVVIDDVADNDVLEIKEPVKAELISDDEDDVPLINRKRKRDLSESMSESKKKKRTIEFEADDSQPESIKLEDSLKLEETVDLNTSLSITDESCENFSESELPLSPQTAILVSLETQMSLFKRNNLFKGVPKSRVCQICLLGCNVIRCRGVCCGFFHQECATIEEKAEVKDVKPETDAKEKLTPELTEQDTEIFKNMSLAEQIDYKLRQIMEPIIQKTYYGDASSDYSSSEETSSDKHSELTVIEHVTADDVILASKPLKKHDLKLLQTTFKCNACLNDQVPSCLACGKDVSPKGSSLRQPCSMAKCGKYYHPQCLKVWPQTQFSLGSSVKFKEADTITCPMHTCHICISDNPRAAIAHLLSTQTVKCLKCPASYHSNMCCIPAGTSILSSTQIICPRHLAFDNPTKIITRRTINTTWCFICSKGGHLICCETCPTSVHPECWNVTINEDDTFICEDCETGRLPLYDEIVWVKIGNYRWWPALILFPNEVPTEVAEKPHDSGEFVVQLFGLNMFHWVSRGRVFLFQEDDNITSGSSKKRVDLVFQEAVKEAAHAHRIKTEYRACLDDVKIDDRPPKYVKIKTNRPVGNVKLLDGNVSNTTPCSCDLSSENPCGPDSYCLNRLLLTECDPEVCPAKDQCQNQMFEKRQYPNLTQYKTEARGWGLKTLEPIAKGQFVIEYVGELIDDQEYQRRIKKMHEQKDDNYYFLTIDTQRIIDAGPKGNIARFMNHSCEPNCETQKWTVKGLTRVGLFAKFDIPEGSEVTFNYNLESVGEGKKICNCGAASCSGFIGVKVKTEEKKPKKTYSKLKKKRSPTPLAPVVSNEPCFICGKLGDTFSCHNKICTKYYHTSCVKLESKPDGKWSCPWHNCNICSKRTIRCCVKCINSYCPLHSEANVRHDKLLGFICTEHDPTKEPQEVPNNLIMKKPRKPLTPTEESDVTSTTFEETEMHDTNDSETSSTNRQDDSTEDSVDLNTDSIMKKKRGRSSKKRVGKKRLKLAENLKAVNTVSNQMVPHEVILTGTIPERHLRTNRKVSEDSESEKLLKRQRAYEKDLPIRKRTTPRTETTDN